MTQLLLQYSETVHDAKWHVRILEQIIHFFDRYLQNDAHKTTSFKEYFLERNKPVPKHEYVNLYQPFLRSYTTILKKLIHY